MTWQKKKKDTNKQTQISAKQIIYILVYERISVQFIKEKITTNTVQE